MKYISLLLVFHYTAAGSYGDGNVTAYSNMLADMWLDGADVIRILWRDCSKKLIDVKDVIDHTEYFPKFMRCMKRKTLRALDRSLSTDVVPLSEGVNLVRYEMVDRSGNVMYNQNETSSWTEKELDEVEWRNLALQRLAKVLRTHVIKFDFDADSKKLETVEYRGRRRHQMMTMMMFGIVSVGMVFVPMGFQFLAVLGGKALLLAKMALILASIQGLKKISASPVNFGYYPPYPPAPAPAPAFEHFEKRSHEDWLSDFMASTPLNEQRKSWLDNLKTHSKSKYDKMIKVTAEVTTWKPKTTKMESEARLYPVYTPDSNFVTSIDALTSLSDLTTRPGEVQADVTLDLPLNGLRFQSPDTVV